jgi:hypothetical protein
MTTLRVRRTMTTDNLADYGDRYGFVLLLCQREWEMS